MALAERLSGPLITCDTKLAATTGSRCSFNRSLQATPPARRPTKPVVGYQLL
jgi:hypothetical protein